MHSPWVGIDLAADRVAWARLLRRAHEVALSGQGTPAVLRPVIVRSWARCREAGVDPDRPAPLVLDAEEAARRLAAHPLAGIVALVRRMLAGVADDARHLVALGDADGMLLWAEGHPSMLEAGAAPHFLPGGLCSEAGIGTNAIGTALALDHPVQVFSAEHFNRLLHGWTTAAAPIHDPAGGGVLGVVGVSGSFRTAHPHTLSLVAAVAAAAEEQLTAAAARREQALRSRYAEAVGRAADRASALVGPDGRVREAMPPGWLGGRVAVPADGGEAVLPGGTRVVAEPIGDRAHVVWAVDGRPVAPPRPRLALRALGTDRAVARLLGRSLRLSRRHSEIVVLLALHPDGLSGADLAAAVYGPGRHDVTLRAEITRLRQVLGPLVAGHPYRLLAAVEADFLDVRRALERGDAAGAVGTRRGPLLAASRAPGIVAARRLLERESPAGVVLAGAGVAAA
jgi:hypothetical protein